MICCAHRRCEIPPDLDPTDVTKAEASIKKLEPMAPVQRAEDSKHACRPLTNARSMKALAAMEPAAKLAALHATPTHERAATLGEMEAAERDKILAQMTD